MIEDTNIVSDYGWRDSKPKPSQMYLAKPIIDTLRNLNVRRVLDLGCGNGAMFHYLQTQGFSVVGCDVDEEGVGLASSSDSGAIFKRVGVYDSPDALGETGFDAVVSTEVIEHLFLPGALPRFAREVLKPGGYLIITTPYHGYFKNLLICMVGKWDSHHTSLWDGGHIKFWSYRSLSALLEANGFEVVGFKGAGRIYGLWKSMVMIARVRDEAEDRAAS